MICYFLHLAKLAVYWCHIFGNVSPNMCSYFLVLFGSSVATFWEITAHSVDQSCLCIFTICIIRYFPFFFFFEGMIWVHFA